MGLYTNFLDTTAKVKATRAGVSFFISDFKLIQNKTGVLKIDSDRREQS